MTYTTLGVTSADVKPDAKLRYNDSLCIKPSLNTEVGYGVRSRQSDPVIVLQKVIDHSELRHLSSRMSFVVNMPLLNSVSEIWKCLFSAVR